ncbi:MAG: hypothetical protein ONB23_05390 [candidate division KSB1 bacterium]|nr:hypothetical protein [candidate division KSB1 bacterium]
MSRLRARVSRSVTVATLLLASSHLFAAVGQPRRVWRRPAPERGVSLAVHAAVTYLSGNFYDVYLPLRRGAGGELAVGYRWNRRVQTYLALLYSEHVLPPRWLWHDRYGLLVAELRVVLPLVARGRTRPAVVLGYGRGVLAGGEELLRGTSLAAGLQVEWFVADRWSLGAAVLARYVDYDHVQYRLPTLLSTGTVDGSNLTLGWLRVACHLGRVVPVD